MKGNMENETENFLSINMAAINPQHMKEVLSKPHNKRQDFEVRMAVDWLRNTVRHFKSVKDNVMWRLVEEGKTEKFDQHQLIILEGDIGDVMYVLLTGNVSIYRKREIETEDRREDKLLIDSKQRYPDRSAFGEEVAVLENPGIIFGEIALIEDAPRSASIIANDVTQLFTISRDLYARTVREVVEKEFRDKHDFINHTPCFQNWNPRYKKQLAMALHVVNYDFEGPIAKQGDQVKGIHYILRGQVRLSVIPHTHVSQYGTQMSPDEVERVLSMGSSNDDSSISPQSSSPVRKLTPTQQRMERARKSSNQNRPLEVCLLDGNNEEAHRSSCFGDTEVILGYDTYLCSVTATERTVILQLDMRSFDRLVLRRNARAVELMKEDNKKRLALWLDRTHSKVPFFWYSLERLSGTRSTGKSLARSHSDRAKNGTSSSILSQNPHNSNANTLQLPPNGPLVDQYGPGTVFNYIRQKDSERKARKAHTSRFNTKIDRNAEHRRLEDEERALDEIDRRKEIMDLLTAADNFHSSNNQPVMPVVSLEESESVINNLEARLRSFLNAEDESKSSPNALEMSTSPSHKYKLQVTPMARARKVSDPLPFRTMSP